jgi:hypothetical protein
MNDHMINAMAHARLDDLHKQAAEARLRRVIKQKPIQQVTRILIHGYLLLPKRVTKTGHHRQDTN